MAAQQQQAIARLGGRGSSGRPFWASARSRQRGSALAPWLVVALLVESGALASPQLTMLPLLEQVRAMRAELGNYFWRTVDISVEQDPAKPKAEPPEPEPPAEPEPEPEPTPRAAPPPIADKAPEAPHKADNPYGEAPRPEAAEAPDVLTKGDDPVDLGWTIVAKPGSLSTGGGYTSAEGTAQHAVKDPRARAHGVNGGRGNGDGDGGPTPVNRSRPAMPIGNRLSDCPFPPQADLAQIDHAIADIAVTVDAQGRATGARVMADPGYGFGGQARRCALSMRYHPALDRDGAPVVGTTPTLRFRFNR